MAAQASGRTWIKMCGKVDPCCVLVAMQGNEVIFSDSKISEEERRPELAFPLAVWRQFYDQVVNHGRREGFEGPIQARPYQGNYVIYDGRGGETYLTFSPAEMGAFFARMLLGTYLD